MIILYQPPGAWGSPSVSPFCIKLELYLKMAGLPYEVQPADMRCAPRGKVPFVSIDAGPLLADSQVIIEELKRRYGNPLDARLNADQRARGHLVRRTLEEATYFASLYLRWGRDSGYAETSRVFRSFLPAPLALLLPLIRRRVRASLWGQGTGRLSEDEICEAAIADWTAVSRVLGGSTHLLGDLPSSYDATLYAFLEALLCFPVGSPVQAHVQATENLVDYHARMKGRWFPRSQRG